LLSTIFFATKNKKYGIFYISTIYLFLSLVDTYIPSLLWITNNQNNRPQWLVRYSNSELSLGLLYYTSFYLLMILTLIFFSKKNIKKWVDSYDADFTFIKKRINIFLLITGGLFIIGLMYEINSYGGFSEWVFNKFTIRFMPTVNNFSLVEYFLIFIPWRNLFDTLVYVTFLYRYRLSKPKLYGAVLPIVSIVFSLTTSHRGSILLFLIGLFFVEYIRIFIHKKYNYNSSYGIGRETFYKLKYFSFSIIIIGSFLIYGKIRANYLNEVLDREKDKRSTIYSVLNQGSGLQGISSIMRRYGNDLDFLMGKTYIDMLLLPIPRSIYTSKPEWYGIDDITKGMGWPRSTQSAVTLSGESYANFGWFGLTIAIVYGIFFSLLLRLLHNMGGIYIVLYGTVVIPLIFMSNWMAFTGMMNRLMPSLCMYIILLIISFKNNTRKYLF
jgi:hypothetical protein